ncbi:MAG: hypothetical protein JW892_10510, partial [Anaerolineae bacterium]|nr:hypothetical protein [Anaerolineae bacterium]
MADSSFPLPKYLQAQEELFREATRQLQSKSNPQSLSAAAEWLPDNSYLVQQICRQIREDMPAGFYRQLPKCDRGLLQNYPRVYAIAQRLIVMCKVQLNMGSITRFVRLYQTLAPLTTGELWALPVMLRLGLVEFLAQSVSRITDLTRTYALPTLTLPHAITGDETVASCITSLRMLAIQDWQDFFESVSQVEHILREDPARIYAKMDPETRDRYRKVVEKLAHATDQNEQSVAGLAIELALTQPATAHVGYYLLDAGLTQLEARLGYRPLASERARRWALAHPTPVYLGGIGLIALGGVLGGVLYAQA